jgi:hypothetical protein
LFSALIIPYWPRRQEQTNVVFITLAEIMRLLFRLKFSIGAQTLFLPDAFGEATEHGQPTPLHLAELPLVNNLDG